MDAVKGAHRNDPSLQITKAQLDGWLGNLGFTRQEQVDLSEDKWFAVYARRRVGPVAHDRGLRDQRRPEQGEPIAQP